MEVEGVAQTTQLFAVLCCMFLGSMLAGAAPYYVRVRESQVQTAAALGGGLLIGTALAVIVPEGFHALAAGAHAEHTHEEHSHEEHAEHGRGAEGLGGLALVAGFLGMLLLDHLQHAAGGGHHHCHPHSGGGHSHGGGGGDGGGGGGTAGEHKAYDKGLGKKGSGDLGGPLQPDVVVSLLGGSSGAAAVAAGGSTAGLPGTAPVGSSASLAGGSGGAGGSSSSSRGAPERAITGLLVHCAADGLALGAAALSGDARLSAIVAVAMVLHKAPMAFGLSTYLLSCHWPWHRAQRTLVAFSAAAPLATIATYWLFYSLPLFTTPSAVALAVVFSGGTFLYAATMHILPEVLSGGGGQLSTSQLAAVTIGCLLPLLLAAGHSH